MSNHGLNSQNTSIHPLNEDRLRSILDHQPEMICRFLADTTILFINQAYCDFLRKPAKQLIGKKLCDLFSRSQSRKILENIDSLVHRKKPIKYEHRIMGNTSKITWQIWHYQAIRDEDGNIIEFQSTGRDITALKENQEVVKNSKKNLNAIFNSQNDGLILLDKDMEVLIFNKAFSRFLSNHWERPLEPGHNIKDYIFPEDLSIFITDFDRSLRGEFIVREKQFSTTSGYSLWYEQNFSPVEDDLGNVFAVALRMTEITKQKKVEEQIKKKRIQQKIILDNIPDSVWLKDHTGKFLSVNKPFIQQINKRIEEIIGKTDYEIWGKNLASKYEKDDKEILKSGKHKLIEESIGKEGEKQWFEIYKAPVYDENGNIIGTTGIKRDITNRKKDAAVLEELKNRYLLITQNLPNTVFFIFDKEQNYLLVEGQGLGRLNPDLKAEDIKNPESLFPPEVAQQLKKDYAQVLKGETVNRESPIEGHRCYFQSTPIPQSSKKNADIQGVSILFILDPPVSSETTSPEGQNHNLKELLQNFGSPSFILEQNGPIVHLNQAASRLIGYYPDEAKQFSFKDLFISNLSDLTFKDLSEGRHLQTENPVEIFLLSRKGVHIPIILDIIPLPENQFLLIGQDISVLKSKLMNLEQEKAQAKHDAHMQSQFLSTMSHEIRTPLNSIIAMTHLLLQENPRPEQMTNLNTLKFSGQNLLVIINDILDFNKIESGKINIESVEFDIRELVNSIREELRYKSEQKNIPIIVRIDDRVHPILIGDPVRLSQILTNLIDNAVKFTTDGEVRVDIDLDKDLEQALILHVSVKDTGIGIEGDKIEAIFERFTQANSDTTRKFGGTGLGLSITKKLLQLLESEIQVESTPGQGSRFHFSLQLPKSTKTFLPVTNPNRNNQSQNLNGARVLMVEDNEMNQLVASQFLNKWNAQIDYAQNGEIAVEMVQKKEYDIILMDLEMPIMNGYQTTQKIRKLGGAFKYLPIIALTASAMSDVKDKVLEAGMNDYVAKPFSPQDLFEKLNKNLHIKKVNSEIFEKTDSNSSVLIRENQINFNKIIEISGGNKAFIKRYKELAHKIFREFPVDYKDALQSMDYEKLRKINHNIRATIGILGLYALDVEIQNGKRLLKEVQLDDKEEIEKSIKIVQRLCNIYTDCLKEYKEE